jgi:cytochrome P450
MKTAPSIEGEPILGSLRAFKADRLTFLERAAQQHGDVVAFRLGWRRFYLVAHPEGVKRILVDNYPNYRKESRGQELLKALLGQGLVTAEDETWKRLRRLSQPAFHKDRIAAFAPLMTQAAVAAVSGWRAGEELDVTEAMSRLTLTIVGRSLMSTDLSDSASDVGEALTFVLRELSARTTSIIDYFLGTEVPTCRNRRLKQAIGTLDRMVAATIAERRRSPGGHEDLLSLLMAARDDDGGGALSDTLLRDQVMTMILAGHETTANALAWTFYLLSKDPGVERRAHAEVVSVLGDREPDLASLARFPYLRAVIEESMRLYPPVWALARNVVEPDEIAGYEIPAGSFVFAVPWVTHRHPAVWENPEGFDPDRFLVDPTDRPRFAYFPFGGGARQCIGNTFALMEAQLILAALLRRFRLDLVPGVRVVPEPMMTLRPRGLRMKLTRRSSSKQPSPPAAATSERGMPVLRAGTAG